MNKQLRVAVLWVFVALGYVYHTMCELLPLFAGVSVVTDEMSVGQVPGMQAFMSVLGYLVPLVGLLCSCYGKRQWSNIVNLVLACISFILSLVHMGTDLFANFSWGQAAVLPSISLITALLVVDLWKGLRTKTKQ